MTAEHNNNILIARRALDTLAVRTKVEEDIAFLTTRITTLENHSRPNPLALDTYQNMLNSRIAVLKWLQHGSLEHGTTDRANQRSA